MLYRKIAARIEDYFKSGTDRMMLISGARQIGKSYIIREVGRRMFPNYVEINMEEDKVGPRIFAEARTVNDFYLALSIYAGNSLKDKASTLIFIDEIQAYDHLLTLVKFLMADARFTYIASGSMLGVALKNTQSVPVGSISIERMYPMDFEEFLIANGIGDIALEAMRKAFAECQSLPEQVHIKIMDLFRKYLLTGGLPQAVDSFVREINVVKFRKIQKDVHVAYAIDASKYEEEHGRRLKIRRIFEMIPSNLERLKKRVVVKDIEDKTWKRFDDYEDEFEYLISAGVALEVRAVSKPSYPLAANAGKNLLKLYMNDVGILSGIFFKSNIKAIMSDDCSVNLGSLYETVVAQELHAHGFRLTYYDNKKHGEVDFLVDDTENLSVIPIEVKSGKDYTVHSALDNMLGTEEYHVRRAFVLSNRREVYVSKGVTYMPIYYVMFFNDAL